MMKKLAMLILLTFGGVAHAQLAQVDMSDKEISAFLSGNTIGAYDWGVETSYEYHGPDGEAIWREGEDLYIGTYRVKDGQVCYNYDTATPDIWFCWTFKRDIRTGDIYQWSAHESFYRLYIHGEGDLVSGKFNGKSTAHPPIPEDQPF